MWSRPPPEVACTSSSVESFYRGLIAGAVFGVVFPPPEPGVLARIRAPFAPALLAGSWCFLTSLASCVLTRDGVGFPVNGALSGLFSGSVIALVARWPRESVISTMLTSGGLSVLSHYIMEGQQKDGSAPNMCVKDTLVSSSSVHGKDVAEVRSEPGRFCAAASE
mmetsp:Transcript_33490/g.53350  ORF Transcript_33490/g.53350 Transcript_33490/m.53350 type:complete len:165 (+) Transcript_33490:46-540(+)